MDRIGLDHGSGGEASHGLVHDVFVSRFSNDILNPLDDSAVFELSGGRVAMTTDSYVVDPIFFPGGNIGSLSIHGTVNDLSMQGAKPLYMTLGLILEEGLPMADLIRIVDAAAAAAREAGVLVVAGDTKVVPKGHADKVFINTAGIGLIPGGIDVSAHNARPGDALIINGPIGDHGVAILSKREGLAFEFPLESDSAPLNGLVSLILQSSQRIHVLRDPTRGGLATSLHEIAKNAGVGIHLYEDRLPVSRSVSTACELLGLDPLYIANEGKCVVVAAGEDQENILKAMQTHPFGKDARMIGEVTADPPGRVLLKTKVGGTRILSMLTGEQLPRIC